MPLAAVSGANGTWMLVFSPQGTCVGVRHCASTSKTKSQGPSREIHRDRSICGRGCGASETPAITRPPRRDQTLRASIAPSVAGDRRNRFLSNAVCKAPGAAAAAGTLGEIRAVRFAVESRIEHGWANRQRDAARFAFKNRHGFGVVEI